MAPEILLHQPYKGAQIDILAAGIILFIMIAEHPPFTSATPKDPFYKCLAANRADVFWATYEQDLPEGFFSDDFKDLLTAMLKLNPSERPSIEDILNHKWMKGPMPSDADVVEEFEKRNKMVRAQIKANKKEGKGETGDVHTAHELTAPMRNVGESNEEKEPTKALYEYE